MENVISDDCSERQDTETSPSGETEDKWVGEMGGRDKAQPERNVTLCFPLPIVLQDSRYEHQPQQQQQQNNHHHEEEEHHQSRPFERLVDTTRQSSAVAVGSVEHFQTGLKHNFAEMEESQDSNPSSAGSTMSARNATVAETAESPADPREIFKRLRAIRSGTSLERHNSQATS